MQTQGTGKMKKTVIMISATLTLLVFAALSFSTVRADGPILSLDGMLPSKSDDPNVYPVLQETEWYYGISWNENLTEPGFIEGRAVEYYKRYNGPGDIRSVEFYAYLFSNVSNAETYCSKQIDKIKSESGKTEVSIPDTFAVVYQVTDEYGVYEIGVSWATISNVAWRVEVYADQGVDTTYRLINFTSLERARILEKSNLNSVPELPSLIAVPLFILTTLIMIKIEKRLHRVLLQ